MYPRHHQWMGLLRRLFCPHFFLHWHPLERWWRSSQEQYMHSQSGERHPMKLRVQEEQEGQTEERAEEREEEEPSRLQLS